MYCLNSCTNSFIHTLFLTAPVEQWIVEWRNCKNPARLITNYVPDFDERDSTKHANILLAWTWLRFFAKIVFCHRVWVQSWPLCLIQSWTMLMGKTVALCLFLTKGDRENVGYALDQYVSHLFKRCRWEKKTQKKAKQCIKPSKESSKTWGKREQHHSRKARKGTFRGVAELGFC